MSALRYSDCWRRHDREKSLAFAVFVPIIGMSANVLLKVKAPSDKLVEVEKQTAQRVKLEQRLAALQRELAQGKEKMREQFELYASGEVEQEEFARFQQLHKGRIAQLSNKITTIERQIAKLGEIRGDAEHITLTEGVWNGTISKNGIEGSLELLDGAIRTVRLYPNRAVEISWNFGEI